MKIIERGREQVGWAIEVRCSGKGNGNGGCGAKLLVEQGDVYETCSSCMGERERHYTFCCSACGTETDIENIPTINGLLNKDTWLKQKEKENSSIKHLEKLAHEIIYKLALLDCIKGDVDQNIIKAEILKVLTHENGKALIFGGK